jgi:hypothetical protein
MTCWVTPCVPSSGNIPKWPKNLLASSRAEDFSFLSIFIKIVLESFYQLSSAPYINPTTCCLHLSPGQVG